MEASLEVLIHKFEAKSVWKLLEKESIANKFDDNEQEGLCIYREIRNTLHHGAGDPTLIRNKPEHLKVEKGMGPQVLYEHMCNFYELFKKIGMELKNKE